MKSLMAMLQSCSAISFPWPEHCNSSASWWAFFAGAPLLTTCLHSLEAKTHRDSTRTAPGNTRRHSLLATGCTPRAEAQGLSWGLGAQIRAHLIPKQPQQRLRRSCPGDSLCCSIQCGRRDDHSLAEDSLHSLRSQCRTAHRVRDCADVLLPWRCENMWSRGQGSIMHAVHSPTC